MGVFFLPARTMESERVQQLVSFMEQDIQHFYDYLDYLYKYISIDEENDDYIDDVSQMIGLRTMKSQYALKNQVKQIKNSFRQKKHLGGFKIIKAILRTYGFRVELKHLWTNDFVLFYELDVRDVIYGYQPYKFLTSTLRIKFKLSQTSLSELSTYTTNNMVLWDDIESSALLLSGQTIVDDAEEGSVHRFSPGEKLSKVYLYDVNSELEEKGSFDFNALLQPSIECKVRAVILHDFVEQYPMNVDTNLYYRFVDDVLDASYSMNEGSGTDLLDGGPNGYDGVITNPTWVDGIKGKALSFDGTSSVDMGDVLDKMDSSEFSIAFWFKTSNTSLQCVLGKMGASPNYTGYELVFDANGRLVVRLVADENTSDYIEVQTVNSFNDDAVHFCVVSYLGTSAASGIIIKIDDLVETQTVIQDTLSSSISNSDDFLIGKREDDSAFYVGIIDEIKVYNDPLNDVEKKKLYKHTSTVRPVMGNVVLGDQVSIKVEFKPDFTYDTADDHTIYCWAENSTTYLKLVYDATSDKFLLKWQDGTAEQTMSSQQFDDGTSFEDIDQILTISVVLDFIAEVYKLYVNGTLIDESWSGTPDSKTTVFSQFCLGSDFGIDHGTSFIYDFKIFNKPYTLQEMESETPFMEYPREYKSEWVEFNDNVWQEFSASVKSQTDPYGLGLEIIPLSGDFVGTETFKIKDIDYARTKELVLMDVELYDALKADMDRFRMSHQLFDFQSLFEIIYTENPNGWKNPWGDVYSWIDDSFYNITDKMDSGLIMDDSNYMDKTVETVLESFSTINFGIERAGSALHEVRNSIFTVTVVPSVNKAARTYSLDFFIEDEEFDHVTEFDVTNYLGERLMYFEFPKIEKTGDKIKFYIEMSY